MWDLSKLKLFNFLIFVSLIHSIRCELEDLIEKTTITEFGTKDGEVITLTTVLDKENSYDVDIKKRLLQKFKSYKLSEDEIVESNDNELNRVTRYINPLSVYTENFETRGMTKTNASLFRSSLDCYFCSANTTSKLRDPCYEGGRSKKNEREKCIDGAVCYVEVNPLYIKRGCISKENMNKTFVCKCPLCNDKSALDDTFFTYIDTIDWEFDNYRLSSNCSEFEELHCKSCDMALTEDATENEKCRKGKQVGSIRCKRDELCYTNLDGHALLIKRGCINKPKFNSFYYFCKSSLCNDRQEYHPYIQRRSHRMFVKNLYQRIFPQDSLLYPSKSDEGSYTHATSVNKVVTKMLPTILLSFYLFYDLKKS